MSSLDQVREHMQVIDAEVTHLGKVDRIEVDRIKLTRDSSAQGRPLRSNIRRVSMAWAMLASDRFRRSSKPTVWEAPPS